MATKPYVDSRDYDETERSLSDSFTVLLDAALRHAAVLDSAPRWVEHKVAREGFAMLSAASDYVAEQRGDKRTQRKRRALGRLLDRIASRSPTIADPEHSDLVTALSEGRAYTPDESAVLELENQQRRFEDRRNLIKDGLTSSQVATL